MLGTVQKVCELQGSENNLFKANSLIWIVT